MHDTLAVRIAQGVGQQADGRQNVLELITCNSPDVGAIDALIAELGDGAAETVIDLSASTASIGETTLPFDLDPVWREKLMNGWDDIDLTMKHRDKIAYYRRRITAEEHWRFPATAG